MDKVKENFETYIDLLKSVKREGIDDLVSFLSETDFSTAPATTRYNCSYTGGLCEHSLDVYNILRTKYKKEIDMFKISNETVILVSLLHDIYKTGFYITETRNVKDKRTGVWREEPYITVDDIFPIGKADKSIIMAQRFIYLTDLEIAMIRNVGGFSRDCKIMEVAKLFSLYPESMLLYFADMEATYILENIEISNEVLKVYRDNLGGMQNDGKE